MAATRMPLVTTRQSSNEVDLERDPPPEASALRLRRYQINPRRHAVAAPPVAHPRPGLITRSTPVGTIGSCFAGRLGDWLVDWGYTFVRTERDPDVPGSWAAQTARFGIVYNTGCIRQVFEAAVGRFHPAERWWRDRTGTLLDPYRKGVAWTDEATAESDLRRHAAAVREAIRRCDVFIVTPGVAEVWQSRADGATFFGAPPRGVLDDTRHRMTLTSVAENVENLERAYAALRELNPTLTLVVTVSPVPLLATFRDLHCTVANAASKATLRVAADAFCASHPEVIYFPSYEIVQGLGAEAYEADGIHVRHEVVERVMVSFMTAYGDLDTDPAGDGTAGDAASAPVVVPDPPPVHPEPEPVFALRVLYWRELVRRLAAEHGARPVALYGAGRHTTLFLAATAGRPAPRYAFVVDDDPRGRRLGSLPVLAPADADPRVVAAVLVSTDTHGIALRDRADAWRTRVSPSPVLETMYDGLPPGPYATADTVRWRLTPG